MPASRAIALADRLSSRSNTGRAVAPAAGTLIITSYVLPADMKTSLCTRETPGSGLPSSAIRLNPGTATAVVPVATTGGVVCAPTIDGTCLREPAFTKRTKTFPVAPVATPVTAEAANSDGLVAAGPVLLNATPLIR